MHLQDDIFPAQPTVLIADDTPSMRKVLEEMVTLSGYKAVTASDGDACVGIAAETRPDLILLDIIMPGGMDGFQTFAQLKRHPETHSIPVIFLTGMDDIDTKLKGFEMGAVDYITKPFHIVEVQARLRLHLKLSFTMNALVHAQQEKLRQIESAQRAMQVLPQELPGAKFAVFERQLEAVGGDFYEVVPIAKQSYAYFVADISGHDLSTGFLTPAIKALLKQNCTTAYSPMESMTLINHVLVGMLPKGKYLTSAYLLVDRLRSHAVLIGMGHPPVILRRLTGEVEIFKESSDVLGAFSEVLFAETHIPIRDGDRFYLYSDGLIEGTGMADVWTGGIDILAEQVRMLPRGLSVQEDVTALLGAFGVEPDKLKDDLLLICTEV